MDFYFTSSNTGLFASLPLTSNSYMMYVCPDLLRYEQIGAADNLRGRVVRAFFFVMRLWPPKNLSTSSVHNGVWTKKFR